MRYGVVLPGGTPRRQVEQAVAAEAAGWDAVFVWEASYHVEPWAVLAAMAERTTRVRLGTMLTPLPFRQPWTTAAQAATVDQLSGGRVVLAVGVGATVTSRIEESQPTDIRERASLLDEGLEIVTALWRGDSGFTHTGDHYRLVPWAEGPARDLRPVQEPRIPVWVVGVWNRPRSMRRAARWDGVIPQIAGEQSGWLDAYAEMVPWVLEQRDGEPVEFIWEGESPVDDKTAAVEQVAAWEQRGATWWLESAWAAGPDHMDARIAAGPPRA